MTNLLQDLVGRGRLDERRNVDVDEGGHQKLAVEAVHDAAVTRDQVTEVLQSVTEVRRGHRRPMWHSYGDKRATAPLTVSMWRWKHGDDGVLDRGHELGRQNRKCPNQNVATAIGCLESK